MRLLPNSGNERVIDGAGRKRLRKVRLIHDQRIRCVAKISARTARLVKTG